MNIVVSRCDASIRQHQSKNCARAQRRDPLKRLLVLQPLLGYPTVPAPLRNPGSILQKMRGPRSALLVCFGGAAAALLGLAWDVSIHSAYPSLAQHETPLDPLSPAHDLIAAVGAAWAIARSVNRWVGALALVPVVVSVGWIAVIALDAPTLASGTADDQAAANQLWRATQKATARYQSLTNARADGYVASILSP